MKGIYSGYSNGETICLWNAKSWDLESVILLEESGILLMIGICTLTAMVMVFRSRWSNFRPYRLKIWPRLWRSNFWPVLLTDLLNARMFNRSKFVLHLSGAMWTKFASKPSPHKFSLLKVYNSLNFSTKCIENPPCVVFFRSQMTQNLARLPEETTPEQISQISSTRISFICCNTEPNYSRYRLSSCRKKLGTDCTQ